MKMAWQASSLLGGVLFAGFVSAAVMVMSRGHLHEDAYILFQYVTNLAEGKGIVFDAVSGPTEGATDFLWMLMLAFCTWLGVDPGTASALFNGLGLACLAYLVVEFRGRLDLASASIIAAIVFSGGTAAALGGFSTLAYGALFVALSTSVVRGLHGRAVLFAVLIALFRPDGVILAAGAMLALIASAGPAERMRLVCLLLPAMLLGLAYLVWRYRYFGLPLPLPLMVKQQTDTVFEGLAQNLRALKPYLWLLIPVMLRYRSMGWRLLCGVASGPLLLFVALALAHQSQNIGFRFQFPIILAILLLFLAAVPKQGARWWAAVALMPVMGIYAGVRIERAEVDNLLSAPYIDSFPQLLRQQGFEMDSIAITEAGRFPYWYDAEQMSDLVGLNSAAVVLRGAAAVLAEQRPEMIFVHHAGLYDMAVLPDKDRIFAREARDIIFSSRHSRSTKNPIRLAPIAALEFAQTNHYRAVVVKSDRNDRKYSHVYFLSRKLDADRFVEVLARSEANRMSYYGSLKPSGPH